MMAEGRRGNGMNVYLIKPSRDLESYAGQLYLVECATAYRKI
jgi:hypothetical protein